MHLDEITQRRDLATWINDNTLLIGTYEGHRKGLELEVRALPGGNPIVVQWTSGGGVEVYISTPNGVANTANAIYTRCDKKALANFEAAR